MSTRNVGTRTRVYFEMNSTDLLAGTAKNIVCPTAGFIVKWGFTIQAAVTTGGVMKLKNVTTDVVGSSITVADAATEGTVQTVNPTVDDATCIVTANQRLQVVPAADFATAGSLNGFIEISSDRKV